MESYCKQKPLGSRILRIIATIFVSNDFLFVQFSIYTGEVAQKIASSLCANAQRHLANCVLASLVFSDDLMYIKV